MPTRFAPAALALAAAIAVQPALAASETPRAAKRPPAAQADRGGDLVARTVFQTLLGEFALRAGDTRLGADAWADLAERTRDPKVIARAIEVTAFARQFDRALELNRLWLEVEPDSAEARQMHSSLLVLANRLEELAPQLAVLLEADKPNLPNNLLHLNRLLARLNDKKAVQQLVDRLAARYDGMPEAHFAMAQAALGAGDNTRARQETEKALQLRPSWEIAALARAQLQVQQSPASAIEGLENFVAANPEARDVRLALARLLVAEKRYDEARRQFERLLQDNPDNPEVIYPVAMLALQQGDTQTGRAQLEKLLGTAFPDKESVHFFLGQIDQEQNRPDAALAHYARVGSGEQYIPARSRIAQIQVQQGRFDDARATLRDTRAPTPQQRTQLFLAEAQLLRDANRHNDAYIVLDSALSAQPDNTDLLYEAALTAERIGKPELLETHLKHLLQINPDHPHALNALGYSLADRNVRLDEAHRLIARAVKLAPEDPFIMDSLGWVLYRQGKLDEALATLRRAYRIKADPEIAAHLGEVLWAMERRDEARQVIREALQTSPGSDVLATAAKKILP